MASFKEYTDKEWKTRYRYQIRMKGYPPQYATFKRRTDGERWAQQTEAAIREGRHFKIKESKKHTLAELIDRYILDVLPTKKKSEQRQGALLVEETNWTLSFKRSYTVHNSTTKGSSTPRNNQAGKN